MNLIDKILSIFRDTKKVKDSMSNRKNKSESNDTGSFIGDRRYKKDTPMSDKPMTTDVEKLKMLNEEARLGNEAYENKDYDEAINHYFHIYIESECYEFIEERLKYAECNVQISDAYSANQIVSQIVESVPDDEPIMELVMKEHKRIQALADEEEKNKI